MQASGIEWFYLLAGGAVCLFLLYFTLVSIRERKPRAAVISLVLALFLGAAWFGSFFLVRGNGFLLAAPAGAVILVGVLFFLPSSRGSAIRIPGAMERVDERDVIFAREEYEPGSEEYNTYYSMRPDNRDGDDRLRRLPGLLRPGGRLYDPVASPRVGKMFKVIERMTSEVDGPVSRNRDGCDPGEMTAQVKEMALRLGADEVGIARLNKMYVYSHVGRGPEEWGAPIRNDHRFALVFSLEMDEAAVEAAPRIGITEETAVKYLKGAQISIAMARTIRGLGYPARAHIAGSNYQIMLPPVAQDAGLGELGRNGYLISSRFGARFRLGAVTTDLPLVPDSPVTLGVQEFCAACRKCAVNCPSGAIPHGERCVVRGVEKWPLDVVKCLHYWRVIGTDCGLCMKVCPYSHPPTLVHNLVRAGISRSAFARRVSLYGDDLFYGRKIPWDGDPRGR